MGAIDIGTPAVDSPSFFSTDFTLINENNAANDTGTISTFEVWLKAGGGDGVGVKVGTFTQQAPGTFTNRDVEEIGAVTAGSKQTFSGLNCDVETGDWAGAYCSAGQFELDNAGGNVVKFKAGDQFGAGEQAGYGASGQLLSLFGTGSTVISWAGGDPLGVAIAGIAKINGVALADITKVNGVA